MDLFTLLALTGVGGAVIGSIEGWTFVECLYFSVQSMTSVGYGDVGPEVRKGRGAKQGEARSEATSREGRVYWKCDVQR